MQRSFSIVDEDNSNDDLESPSLLLSPKNPKNNKESNVAYSGHKAVIQDFDYSDSDDSSFPSKSAKFPMESIRPRTASRQLSSSSRLPSSAGPSGRQTVIKSSKMRLTISDESDSDNNEEINGPIEYNAKMYDNLEVSEEMKEIFQYISKYTPQHLSLDTKFRPFIPEFIPAVGDIDAFLKIIPPEMTPSGDTTFGEFDKQLGLVLLDEPATNQSDPALLHLRLRATSVKATENVHLVVKKVDNLEKNFKTIEKWIKDISDLHKTKSSPTVRYSEPMPDLDDLMQEWPENIENELKENGFPKPTDDMTLSDYVDKISVKNSQLFLAANNEQNVNKKEKADNKVIADQLVLE